MQETTFTNAQQQIARVRAKSGTIPADTVLQWNVDNPDVVTIDDSIDPIGRSVLLVSVDGAVGQATGTVSGPGIVTQRFTVNVTQAGIEIEFEFDEPTDK